MDGGGRMKPSRSDELSQQTRDVWMEPRSGIDSGEKARVQAEAVVKLVVSEDLQIDAPRG
jgi:hypothetical protein